MKKGNGYQSQISHSGTQVVKAPIKNDGGKGKTKVKTGGDLRTGK